MARRIPRLLTILALSFAVGAPTVVLLPNTAIAKKKRKRKKRRKAQPKPAPKPAAAPAAPASDLVPTTQFRGPARIDFDDRLIQGQTNKSGAVYLFDRKETGISSMVKRRKSFRHLTIRSVYDR